MHVFSLSKNTNPEWWESLVPVLLLRLLQSLDQIPYFRGSGWLALTQRFDGNPFFKMSCVTIRFQAIWGRKP